MYFIQQKSSVSSGHIVKSEQGEHFPSLPLFPSLPYPFLPLSPPSLPLPLEVGLLKGAWGSAVSSPSGVWGEAAAEIEYGAF